MELKGLSQHNPLLSALKTAARATQAAPESGTATSAASWSAFNDEQAQLRQTASLLQSARSNSSEESKEAARQKVERIKAQIQALRMAGGDPKMVARQAARLAQELAAAAREYAGGTGGGTAIAGAAVTATAPMTAASGTATGTPAAGSTVSTQAGPVVADVTAPVADDSAAALPTASLEQAAGQEAPTEEAAENQNPDGALPGDKAAAAKPSVATGNSDDENFVREVRRLLAELKNIIKGAQFRMEDDDTVGQADITQANKALRDVEQAVGQIEAAAASGVLMGAVTAGVNITV